MVWRLIGGLASGVAFLVGRRAYRKKGQESAARAAGLEPTDDLTHVPRALQQTALWSLADGGFERRVMHGKVARTGGDVSITAFDLETLRERRGEWAFLPVEPPFRIGGVVSVVVCEVDRRFPHVLFKHAGRGDELLDDELLDRLIHVAKAARDRLGMKRAYPSELPGTLANQPVSASLPPHWRAYTRTPELVEMLAAAGLRTVLEQASRRDLVIELLERVVVVYPAARDVVGPDAFADLTATALQIVDGVLAASPPLTPRGIEHVTTS
ncbi:MAG TPA: hypothetical protein VFV99_18280 [Kofleriaceae bacterium]|nr:hypothetical protein [Kofleriaceae bacterium]